MQTLEEIHEKAFEGLTKTNRTFKCIETNYSFSLYKDKKDSFHLLVDKDFGPLAPAIGTSVNGFYICAHTGVKIKINGEKIISLDMGTFYNLKEGEEITHKKYTGFKRFTKI